MKLSLLLAATTLVFAMPTALADGSSPVSCLSTLDWPVSYFGCEVAGTGFVCHDTPYSEAGYGTSCNVQNCVGPQVLWGYHSEALTVGGYHGCNVVVRAGLASVA